MDKKKLLEQKKQEKDNLSNEILKLELEIRQDECPFQINDIIEYCGQRCVFKGFYLHHGFYSPEIHRIKNDGTLYKRRTWASWYEFYERPVVGKYGGES